MRVLPVINYMIEEAHGLVQDRVQEEDVYRSEVMKGKMFGDWYSMLHIAGLT